MGLKFLIRDFFVVVDISLEYLFINGTVEYLNCLPAQEEKYYGMSAIFMAMEVSTAIVLTNQKAHGCEFALQTSRWL